MENHYQLEMLHCPYFQNVFCNSRSSLLTKYKAPGGKFSVREVVERICRDGSIFLPLLFVAGKCIWLSHGDITVQQGNV